MVVDCAGVETGCIPNAVSVASFLLLLLLLRKDMHFYFLVGVLQLLIIFFLAGLLLLAVLVLPSTSALKQREVPATVSFFYVSVLYTTMLRTSTAAVVLGCLFLCFRLRCFGYGC